MIQRLFSGGCAVVADPVVKKLLFPEPVPQRFLVVSRARASVLILADGFFGVDLKRMMIIDVVDIVGLLYFRDLAVRGEQT